MANDIDFIALYQALGIEPGCALDDFRRAYRRRVAQLHPDRQSLPNAQMYELQHLNALYAAAMQFHLQHGRLPGSVRMTPARESPIHAAHVEAHRTERRPPRRHVLGWALAIAALVAAAVYWSLDESPDTSAPESVPSMPVAGRAAPSATSSRQIQLGMHAAEVLEIQGEPVSRNDTLWEFGPSWISFECDVVSDWYSSRIRPLKVGMREPLPADKDRAARARGRCRASLSPP